MSEYNAKKWLNMFGKDKLQSFQDNFAKTFNISLCFLDLQGDPLCVWSNLPLFCDYMIKNNPRRCCQERHKAILIMRETKKIYIHNCFTGHIFLCHPVYYHDKIVSVAYTGGMNNHDKIHIDINNIDDNMMVNNISIHNIINLLRDVFNLVDYIIPESSDKNIYYTYLKNKLSARELEITYLLLKSKSNKDIANELYISEKTVKTHVSNILHKLDMKERKELLYLEDELIKGSI